MINLPHTHANNAQFFRDGDTRNNTKSFSKDAHVSEHPWSLLSREAYKERSVSPYI